MREDGEKDKTKEIEIAEKHYGKMDMLQMKTGRPRSVYVS